MELRVQKQEKLQGKMRIPGDKSISHRSMIFGSLAEGKTYVTGFLESEDCLHTMQAFQEMGVTIEKLGVGEYLIYGVGLKGLQEPGRVLDCGNSGTTMRLMTGLLAAQNFYSVLTGDDSLRQRPMNRVIQPLQQMGATIYSRQGGYAPLTILGRDLTGIQYSLPVASAQVKSALLLAGLYADGEVDLLEPGISRDHTERMLQGFGVELKQDGNRIRLPKGPKVLTGTELEVPGDISSAAFFIVAGLIIPNSEILIENVGINPTRSGIIEVVEKMGGDLTLLNQRTVGGEPVADLMVRSSQSLHGTTILGEIIPRLIDELPVIALLASQATGETVIRDAKELRVKETDRIKVTVAELAKLGVEIEELEDGMVIVGPQKIGGGRVQSHGDHRIAMMLAIAGLKALETVVIENSQSIRTSFPEFEGLLKGLCT